MPWTQGGPSCCSSILLLLVTQCLSVCLCDFPLCFQSALEVALILMLLSYVNHPYTEFFASPLEEEFVVAP